MVLKVRFVAVASLVSASTSLGAAAHDEVPSADSAGGAAEQAPAGASRTEEANQGERSDVESTNESWKLDPDQKTRLPWHGSTLSFDQSVTTTTVGLGSTYQSADPVYEWWLAFRPRYALYESKLESFTLGLWLNLYLELTNSDTTTTKREPVVGPTWLTAMYGRTLHEGGGYKTSVSLGPRLAFPTDEASRNAGQYLGLGASLAGSQRIPLRGRDAPWLSDMRFGVSTTYSHPITRATTRVFNNVSQPGQDTGAPVEDLGNGRTTGLAQTNGATQGINQDQLGGSLFAKHTLTIAVSADLQVTQKLGASVSYSLINSWKYAPTEVPVCIATGCVEPVRVDGPTTFTTSNWLTASLDYDLLDELSLSLGYYNLAGQIGPDGQRRGVFWSPDARFFLTMTGNLDAIYERLSSKPEPTTTASARR
jgi:hypothetical protein